MPAAKRGSLLATEVPGVRAAELPSSHEEPHEAGCILAGAEIKDSNKLMSQNKLYVGNLSFNSTEDDITDAFSAHGTVTSVNIIMDRDTGRPRGFAFVEMGSDSEAAAAVQALDGQDLGGRNLKVNIAKPREPRGGGGGGQRRDRW
jgi:cold-inducible RNA-binding protein